MFLVDCLVLQRPYCPKFRLVCRIGEEGHTLSCSLLQHTAVAIYGHGLGRIFLPFFCFSALPTCQLGNRNFNRQFGRWVSKDVNDVTRLTLCYTRKCVSLPACVWICLVDVGGDWACVIRITRHQLMPCDLSSCLWSCFEFISRIV